MAVQIGVPAGVHVHSIAEVSGPVVRPMSKGRHGVRVAGLMPRSRPTMVLVVENVVAVVSVVEELVVSVAVVTTDTTSEGVLMLLTVSEYVPLPAALLRAALKWVPTSEGEAVLRVETRLDRRLAEVLLEGMVIV
jgi:hypothetical protein